MVMASCILQDVAGETLLFYALDRLLCEIQGKPKSFQRFFCLAGALHCCMINLSAMLCGNEFAMNGELLRETTYLFLQCAHLQ